MPTVAEDKRIATLRQLGMSEPLVRLTSGNCIHAVFRFCCLGPPWYSYHGAGAPTGPPLVPLWDHAGTVVGVWTRADGPEFVEFSIECVNEVEAVARTEQGFWATRFDFLSECNEPVAKLREAAEAVGYGYLDRQLESRERAEAGRVRYDWHEAWLSELVAGIDREATGI